MTDGVFSKNFEETLLIRALESVDQFLKVHDQPKPRVLGLISQPELRDELNISFNTLRDWEEKGLKRYQPPTEDGRKIYYKISDVLIFLGVNRREMTQ
nr:MAG TPA: Pyocin activator protein PrtN [Caudoviricetes sp.]